MTVPDHDRVEVRDGAVPAPCCFCRRLTLGLVGQDFYLAPYFLDTDRSFADGRYGQCHLKCLQESGLGRRWASGVSDYFCRRWPDWIGIDGGASRVHVSPPTRGIILWSAQGWFAELPFNVLHDAAADTPSGAGTPRPSRRTLSVSSIIGFEGGPYETIFAALTGGHHSRIELPTLLAQLNCADRVLTPHVLRDGWVERVVPESRKIPLPAEYRARHAVEFDVELINACRAAIRRTVGWRRRRR
ncbi:Protein of unknown function [Micromonospora lupini str. Lupac 08]|uniref:Uncharacterized protein n=1 Tax=Micromonospora lupini str. Lupac 08 TaxID=1150864 RepID=I0L4T0_9ACTN|nr:Protein of unknown function [Micromonospora lupini str. Lupac 08]